MMTFNFTIPTTTTFDTTFAVEPGSTLFFVGANGGGKTRLAVEIERQLGGKAHRIAAHRALTLNPGVAKISAKDANATLRYGYKDATGDKSNRWQYKDATWLLNDYDALVQSLFAEQSNTSLESHKSARAGNGNTPSATSFEKLEVIWSHILPLRTLHIGGDNIEVAASGSTNRYSASDMSDGERAVFYLIGQTLAADPDSLIIFDEPELHIHRAIMSRLWDQLEAARPDCAFVMISHDLEFVAGRQGEKWVLLDYDPASGWTLEAVPTDTGFSEAVTTLILGSRRPVLFVEGVANSFDAAFYRACYPGWTILSRGSCQEVIHAVITMRANATLTRVTCAGIVDADGHTPAEAAWMSSNGIEILSVSEIENVLALPAVLEALAASNKYTGAALTAKIDNALDKLFAHATPSNQMTSALGYCRRRIDRALKVADLSSATNIATMQAGYADYTSSIDVAALVQEALDAMQHAIAARDAATLLKWYDNKGVLTVAAAARDTTLPIFESWLVRVLASDDEPDIKAALKSALPTPVAS